MEGDVDQVRLSVGGARSSRVGEANVPKVRSDHACAYARSHEGLGIHMKARRREVRGRDVRSSGRVCWMRGAVGQSFLGLRPRRQLPIRMPIVGNPLRKIERAQSMLDDCF